jgi:Mce-associated membrane protein
LLRRIRELPWRFIVPWALTVLVAGAAIAFAVLWQEAETQESDRDEVVAVARDFTTALTNFSADTIDEDAERIRSFAVGDFGEEVDTFFGPRAVEAIKEADATSTGVIDEVFIQSLDEDEASVFAVVTETITNAATTEPRTDTLRLEVGMIETGSGWKIDRVEVFQSPGQNLLPGETEQSGL